MSSSKLRPSFFRCSLKKKARDDKKFCQDQVQVRLLFEGTARFSLAKHLGSLPVQCRLLNCVLRVWPDLNPLLWWNYDSVSTSASLSNKSVLAFQKPKITPLTLGFSDTNTLISSYFRLFPEKYVCVIKWWRVKLGNNFTRVLSKS